MQEDFEDDVKSSAKDDSAEKSAKKTAEASTSSKNEASESATSDKKSTVDDSTIFDLLDLSTTEPSETDCLLDIFNSAANSCKPNASAQSSSNILTFDFLKKLPGSTSTASAMDTSSGKKGAISKPKMNDKKTSAWMDLFADLDPLANPTTMEKKIAGMNQNCLDA